MRKTIFFVVICLLLAVAAQASPQLSEGTWFLTVAGNPAPELQVNVFAQLGARTTGLWTWTYDVKAIDVLPVPDGVRGFSLDLGAPAALATNITTNAPDWSGVASSNQVLWELPFGIPTADRLNIGQTYMFQFDNPDGPSTMDTGSAQDTYGFFGPLTGPAVPDP